MAYDQVPFTQLWEEHIRGVAGTAATNGNSLSPFVRELRHVRAKIVTAGTGTSPTLTIRSGTTALGTLTLSGTATAGLTGTLTLTGTAGDIDAEADLNWAQVGDNTMVCNVTFAGYYRPDSTLPPT